MTTIKDIAKYTGLSIGTVSRYLNNKPTRKENTEAIQNAIEVLHYQANTMARSLRTNQTKTVGLLLHHWTSPFYMRMTAIVETILHEQGYSIMVCAYDGEEKLEKEKLELLSTRCDALVINPLYIDAGYLNDHLTKPVPVISIDRPIFGYRCDNILVNSFAASYTALLSFMKAGHKKIALLTGTKGLYTSTIRVRAYKRLFEDFNLPVNEDYILYGDFRSQTGFDLVSQLIQSGNCPTALFATTSEMTLGAMAAFNKFGLSFPEDISFIGGDIVGDNAILCTNLNQVIQPVDEFGKVLGERLLKRLENKTDVDPDTIILEAYYDDRSSVRQLQSS